MDQPVVLFPALRGVRHRHAASAWLIVLFWMCVLAGLQYIAAVVLHVLGGTIMVTLLLRIVELTTAPDESGTRE